MPRVTHPRCKSPLTKKSKRKRGRDDSDCMTETSDKKVKEEPDSDSAKVGKASYRPVVGEYLKMHKRWEYVPCKQVPGRIGSCYLFCWTRGEEGFSHWLTSDIPEKVATDCKLYDEKPFSSVERSTKFVASLVDGPEESPTREYSIFTKVEQGATYKSRNEDCKILNEAYTLLVDKKKDVGAAYAAMARLYPTRSSAFYIYNERKTLASEGQKLRQDYWGSMDFK